MTDVPTPDASDRIAAIRAALSDDAEAAVAFAEPAKATVEAALDRLDTISGSVPHAEAIALLGHVRDRVAGLDPARLEPRRGLAGLFDSRGKRLKAFRAAYVSAADAASSGAADLADRGGAIARRGDALEALWSELRAGLTDLDDHIAAGRAWATDRVVPATPLPPEAAAAFEDTPEEAADPVEASSDAVVPESAGTPSTEGEAAPAAELDAIPGEPEPMVLAEEAAPAESVTEAEPTEAEPAEAEAEAASQPSALEESPVEPGPTDTEASSATVVALPHPLDGRLETLAALRARAIAALPRIRALQNADHAVPTAIASVRDRIEAWSADWRDALGLAGKRPRKIRPDAARLIESREALVGHLSSAERVVAAAQTRLAEVVTPSATPATDIRAAA